MITETDTEALRSPAEAKKQAKAMRPWYKKKRYLIGGSLVGLVVISALAAPSEEETTRDAAIAADVDAGDSTPEAPAPTDAAPPTTIVPSTTTVAPPTTSPPVTAPPETVSQQNARQKAADYLDFSSFSRSGLIGQLEFEGFPEPDAAYGVDALNVDWNEQAAKKAADYLELSSFSRSGLIEQLVFEGFTQAQAEYGVGTTGL